MRHLQKFNESIIEDKIALVSEIKSLIHILQDEGFQIGKKGTDDDFIGVSIRRKDIDYAQRLMQSHYQKLEYGGDHFQTRKGKEHDYEIKKGNMRSQLVDKTFGNEEYFKEFIDRMFELCSKYPKITVILYVGVWPISYRKFSYGKIYDWFGNDVKL